LGCVFLEMIDLCNGYSLDYWKDLRPERDHSFQANIQNILRWFDVDGTSVASSVDQHLMGIVREMLSINQKNRPTALEIETRLRLIDAIGKQTRSVSLWGKCCNPLPPPASKVTAGLQASGLSDCHKH